MPLARCLVVLGIAATGFGALPATAGAASADDPLQSAGCRRAVAVLRASEADAASAAAAAGPARSGGNPDPRLVAARRQAAVACLATRSDPAPGRLAQPPIVVAPVGGAAPARPPAVPTPAAAMPSLPLPGPRFITSCDPGGCWADDGSRLDRVGPTLWGRGGACSVLGSVVTCR